MKMREMLQAGEWLIGDSCQSLIETLPMLTRDEKKPEDGIKFECDDALDATRYLLYSRHRSKQAPLEDRIQARIAEAEITEPTSVMVWRRKFEAEERRKLQPVKFGRRGLSRDRRPPDLLP